MSKQELDRVQIMDRIAERRCDRCRRVGRTTRTVGQAVELVCPACSA